MPSTYNEQLKIAGVENDTVYTYDCSVIGGLELTGVDPSAMTPTKAEKISKILRNVIQLLPDNIVLSQYYVHYEGVKIHLKQRTNQRSSLLSKRREAFLNTQRNLNGSRIIWLIELLPEENLNSFFSVTFLKNLFNSFFEPEARKRVGLTFKYHDAYVIEQEDFEVQCRKLKEALDDLDLRLDFLSPGNKKLTTNDLWRFNKFMANFKPLYLLKSNCVEPKINWDQLAFDGEKIDPVTIKGVPMLKLEGSTPTYIRIASILQQGQKSVPYGAWALGLGNHRPALIKGNYVIYNQFRPLNSLQRDLLLKKYANEVHRTQLRFKDLIQGNVDEEMLEEKAASNKRFKKMLDELMEAEETVDKLGLYVSSIVVYDEDPLKLIDKSSEIHRIISDTMTLVWESVGLEDAYYSVLPAHKKTTYRTLTYWSSQVAASALFYKSTCGINSWKKGINEQEEAYYILESDDGVPFFYTPLVGEKLLVIGVGPTRSGKTFFKNVIASHFTKFGGIYSSLDVDQGTIPLANFFQNDGGSFTMSETVQHGLNTFVSAKSKDDDDFINHFVDQIKLMLKFNDREVDRTLSTDEKEILVDAIKSLLEQHFEYGEDRISVNSFSTLMSKCGRDISKKLLPFYGKGYLHKLFDNVDDAIGQLDKLVSVYNLASVKDRPEQAQLMQHEIFFRIVRLFESAKYRETPKFLEIDEAQYSLSVPGAAEWAIAKSRTWFKHGGGMGFWTQSPEHYYNLDEWETLKAAASVFIFMADPYANNDHYNKAFGLDNDEVQIIRDLKPRQQAFIVIRERNIAKVVNLFVESEQYVICTSSAHEAALAEKTYAKYPPSQIDKAIDEIVEKLGMEKTVIDEEQEEIYL